MAFIESMILASQAYNNAFSAIAAQTGISLAAVSLLFGIVSLWSLAWKGIALWKSARKKSPVWFIVLLAVNTIGILEILYIFIFSKIGKEKPISVKARKTKK